jgi:hypothetical protein
MLKALHLFSVMEQTLSRYEEKGFCEISFAIGDEKDVWYTLDDIKGVLIPQPDKLLWMNLLVEKGFYESREREGKTEYKITGIGLGLFNKLRDKLDRAAQPVPFRYPKEFKGTRRSYY